MLRHPESILLLAILLLSANPLFAKSGKAFNAATDIHWQEVQFTIEGPCICPRPPPIFVEKGMIDEIFYDPRHPYTWGLLSAMPDLDTNDERLYAIPGSPPNLMHERPGDAFAPRNIYALNIDDRLMPPMFRVTDTHYAATWLLHENAPKVEMPPELKARIQRMKKEAES